MKSAAMHRSHKEPPSVPLGGYPLCFEGKPLHDPSACLTYWWLVENEGMVKDI